MLLHKAHVQVRFFLETIGLNFDQPVGRHDKKFQKFNIH